MNDNTPPRWTDGEPANLAAAAHDAREWLIWVAQLLPRTYISTDQRDFWLDGRTRIARCIKAIERFAPTKEQEPTP